MPGTQHQGQQQPHDTGDTETVGSVYIEIIHELAVVEQQLRPGQRPLKEIRFDDRMHVPFFQMLDLQRLVEQDAMTGKLDAVSQFNIFNTRTVIFLFVEAAQIAEDISPDRPAGPPKSGRFFPGVLMYVMMEQVAVLGQEIILGGGIVIGTEECSDIRSVAKDFPEFTDRIRFDRDIGIDKKQDIASGLCGAEVTGFTGSPLGTGFQNHNIAHGIQAGGMGGTAVSHDDDLIGRGRGGLHRRQTTEEFFAPVVYRDDHRNTGVAFCRCKDLHLRIPFRDNFSPRDQFAELNFPKG